MATEDVAFSSTAKTHLEYYTGKLKIPVIGYGMWLANDPAQLEQGLEHALEIGYRHFDTATMYENESILGKVLNNWIRSGKGAREELFITTKLPIQGAHPDRVEYFLNQSLQYLQMEYIDLYLIHNPAAVKMTDSGGILREPNGDAVLDTDHILEDTWVALEEQVRLGKTKAIGLSNVGPSQVDRIAKFGLIKPANVQVEMNAAYPKKQLRRLCKAYGITVTAFAPLGSPGRLGVIDNFDELMVPKLLDNPIVQEIGAAYNKTAAQVLLKFLVQNGVAVIPKSVTPERIAENFVLFDFELDEEAMKELETLDTRKPGTWGWDWVNFLPGLDKHPEFQEYLPEGDRTAWTSK